MKDKAFSLVVGSFIFFILYEIVFFSMSSHVETNENFVNRLMLYLTFILMIATGIVSFLGYVNRQEQPRIRRLMMIIVFWLHVLSIVIVIATLIYQMR